MCAERAKIVCYILWASRYSPSQSTWAPTPMGTGSTAGGFENAANSKAFRILSFEM